MGYFCMVTLDSRIHYPKVLSNDKSFLRIQSTFSVSNGRIALLLQNALILAGENQTAWFSPDLIYLIYQPLTFLMTEMLWFSESRKVITKQRKIILTLSNISITDFNPSLTHLLRDGCLNGLRKLCVGQ